MMTTPLTPQDWETLSAYLDGQLAETEKRQIQDLTVLRPELKQGLEELRRTRALLRAAPRRRAPRNFTLSAEMAQKARPRFRWGWTPSFSFASAMAAVFLVLSFFFRVNLAQLSFSPPMTAQAPQAMSQANNTSTGNPPIIVWNNPGVGGGFGGGLGGAEGTGPADVMSVPSPADRQALPEATVSATEISPDLSPTLAPSDVPKLAAPLATRGTIVSDTVPDGSETGPILGIRPTEERGKMFVPTETMAYQAEQANADNWKYVQFGLAGLAVVFALAAFLTWRKAHR